MSKYPKKQIAQHRAQIEHWKRQTIIWCAIDGVLWGTTVFAFFLKWPPLGKFVLIFLSIMQAITFLSPITRLKDQKEKLKELMNEQDS